MSQTPRGRTPDVGSVPSDDSWEREQIGDDLLYGAGSDPRNIGLMSSPRPADARAMALGCEVDDRGIPLSDRVTLIFDDLLPQIHELGVRLRTVEHCMNDLAESFATAVPRTRLRLRAWARKKDERPYALYWVFLVRREHKFDGWGGRIEDDRPRWFHRLKVQSYRYLDGVIYRAGLAEHRRTILRYHAQADALNAAHRVLARGLDSARKMLGSWITGSSLFRHPPMPERAHELYLGPQAEKVARLLWKFDRLLFVGKHLIRGTAERQAKEPRWVRFRLVYLEDSDHPYGRLTWRDLITGLTYTRLDDRTKRRLRLYPEVRKAITRWEKERRSDSAIHKKRTALIRRLKALVTRVLEQTSTLPKGEPPLSVPNVESENFPVLPENDFPFPSESGYFGGA